MSFKIRHCSIFGKIKKKLPAKDLLMLKFCKNYSTFVVLWEMLAKELFLSKDLGKTH